MFATRRQRFAFRAGDTTFYPYDDEVIWIRARRNYCEVHTCSRSFTVRELLASLERRLPEHRFFRIHRSWMINLEHVVEIRREKRARYSIVLTDGSSVVVPLAVKEQIETLLAPTD